MIQKKGCPMEGLLNVLKRMESIRARDRKQRYCHSNFVCTYRRHEGTRKRNCHHTATRFSWWFFGIPFTIGISPGNPVTTAHSLAAILSGSYCTSRVCRGRCTGTASRCCGCRCGVNTLINRHVADLRYPTLG